MKLSKIIPNPSNPRVFKDYRYELLKKSIQDFPEMLELRPLVIDENNMILGGNMRYKALKELGIKDVPVKIASNLTLEQKREFIIKDNINFGNWDYDILANDWDDLELKEWGMELNEFMPHNNMTEDDVNLEQEFDPYGIAKDLHKIVIIFDNESEADSWFKANLKGIEYKKFNKLWQINLSTTYGA